MTGMLRHRAAIRRKVITLPVIRAAASDARYAMTSATSAGVATCTCVGLPATNCRTASVTQPVSVTGGCTTFAVIPRSASSTAADIV